MVIFRIPTSTLLGDQHNMRLLTFLCTQFNAQQLLFEAFLDIMRIFGIIEP